MKILQVTSHFSPNVGGVETHLNDLVLALSKRNHKVFVLTYRPLTTVTNWNIYEKKNSIEIFRIPWVPGFFYKLVRNPVLEFFYLVPGLFFVLPILLLFRDRKIKTIHSHGLVAGFVSVFWGKIFGKRVLTTTHSIYNFSKTGIYKDFAQWIFKNSDIVLTLSRKSGDEITKLGIPRDKIKVFTYWVDLKRFRPISGAKDRVGLRGRFVVFCASRLVQEKGIRHLLEAAQTWDKRIHLVVSSDGPLRYLVEQFVSKFENIHYVGVLTQDEIAIYYNAADLLIIPSTHEEGFGRVILEALACGTPVIGSNRGAISEAMDETVGKLIKVTPTSIKNAVEYFYKNPDRLGKLSKNARKFAQERYSENNVETIIKTYRN